MTVGNTLNGRVALITGASGGIGQALAPRLAAEGAAVALGYGSSAEPAGKLAAEIVSGGGRAVALGADLRTSQAPAELVDAVEASLGPVGVLVANAWLGRIRGLWVAGVSGHVRDSAVVCAHQGDGPGVVS